MSIQNSKFEIQNSTHPSSLIVGTRGSALARWQTAFVLTALKRVAPAVNTEWRIIQTTGDRDQTRPIAELGDLGVFTKEIEHALLTREIDFAVHSLKDLPTEMSDAFALAAILERADARDCIVSRHRVGLMELPHGARVGTSSARRGAQIRAPRPDITIVPLRGNVDTRLRKAQGDEYDAIVLAAAGLIRLGRADEITEYLPLDVMLPDPGQGALAVQVRAGDTELAALLEPLNHPSTRAAVTAERAFLRALGGGCRMPMAAYAELDGKNLRVRGMVAALNGTRIARGELSGAAAQAEELGRALAEQLLQAGAAEILGQAVTRASDLTNKRIIITRAQKQASELAEKIRARGGEPIEFPTIAFAPLADFRALDEALARANEFDWIVFTSANGARAVMERLREAGSSPARFHPARVAAIGPGTARALEANGIRVAFIPSEFLGAQIARELPIASGQRALLLRADLASDVLANGLIARGVLVTDVDAYLTVTSEPQEIDLTGADAVTFTSSSIVRNFMVRLDDAGRAKLDAVDVFCIGPVTAETAREFNLRVTAIAAEHTLDGLVATLVNYYERNE